MRNVTLILDDGSRFSGKSFGYEKPVAGEVVFNTAMTGYPESLTDPSYAGQLMTLTYPLVGNYGVPPFTIEPNGLATFMESEKIHAEAIIVSDYSYEYSHWNAVESLGDWLKREKVPGITGIDTRELTKVLREHGVMMGKIVFENEELRMKNEEFPSYSDINYVDQVSCKEIIHCFPSGTSSHSAANSSFFIPNSSFIKWYDHEAHRNFDVCADDHCQRYQGITRASTPQAIEAVSATRGEVLMYKGAICDARFSKCCGGAFEEFQNCWENVKHPYLIRQRDSKTEKQLPDLNIEAEADKWIRTSPVAFCNTQDKKILSQVLNNYDQETADFYRWKVSYSQQELSELIHQRSGIDFGQIIDLIPVERGTSGRLVRLKIVGTLRTLIIGKELEIRRTLSTSHLYSSAFVVDKEYEEKGHKEDKIPSRFILTGAGWGHGVGLCQIGAAVMGEQGYKYEEILSHYYPGSTLEKQYQ